MHYMHGHSFDYTPKEAVEILQDADLKYQASPDYGWPKEMRGKDCLALINGEWMQLARVDLFDQCCTTTSEWWGFKSEQEMRAHFIEFVKKCYGVRIKRYKGRERATFAFIDSMTDG